MNPKLDKDGWPLEIPWPEGGEWTRRKFSDGERCCLVGWMRVAFTGQAEKGAYGHAYCAIADAMHEETKTVLTLYNDTHDDRELSELWSKVWRKFGYEEVRR